MSSSVQIIVDDFDPRITYTPSDKWTTGGVELEHNSTTHGFNDGAGSFAFNFNGTGISIYTTVPPFERETPPGVVCKIDGTEIERFTPTGAAYNFLACRSPTLDADKDHLLEVEVTRMAAWPTFHLDYMIYESVVGDNTKGAEGSRLVGPEGESVRIMVDEADGRVVYGGPEGAWRDGGVDAEHNGTTHVTDTGGATATYTFFGTGIQVYGTLVEETSSKSPFIATFQIDDSPPVIYTSPSIKGLQYRRRFFRSPVLEENVEHKLVIMDTTEGAGRFILDYFVQTTSPSSLLAQGIPDASSPDSNDSDKDKGSTSESESTSESGLSVGVIAGASVGAVVILALILGFFVWRRRKAGRSRGKVNLGSGFPSPQSEAGPEVTEPFVRPTPFTTNSGSASGSYSQPGSGSASQVHLGWAGHDSQDGHNDSYSSMHRGQSYRGAPSTVPGQSVYAPSTAPGPSVYAPSTAPGQQSVYAPGQSTYAPSTHQRQSSYTTNPTAPLSEVSELYNPYDPSVAGSSSVPPSQSNSRTFLVMNGNNDSHVHDHGHAEVGYNRAEAGPLPRKGSPNPPVQMGQGPVVQHRDGGVRLDRDGDGEEGLSNDLPPVYQPSYA